MCHIHLRTIKRRDTESLNLLARLLACACSDLLWAGNPEDLDAREQGEVDEFVVREGEERTKERELMHHRGERGEEERTNHCRREREKEEERTNHCRGDRRCVCARLRMCV